MRGLDWRRSLRVGVAAAAAVVGAVGFAAPAVAGGDGHDGGKRDVTVMTQNLYLGSSLDAALVPGLSQEQFVAAVAKIYGTAVTTNFPLRAQTIADEIKADRPDLIGLQEVTNWVAVPTHAGPTPMSFDFLEILLDALKSRGLNYEAEVTAQHVSIGPVPLVAPQFRCQVTATDCAVTFQDRDVILRNLDTEGLDVTAKNSGNFPTQATVTVLGRPLSFERGWAYLDGTFNGSKFRFVTTHLEVDKPYVPFGQVQEQQARELVAGPLKTLRPVILVGDLNSPADGRTTNSYFTILKALFVDAWWTNLGRDPGFSCCQDELLNNTTSKLFERIDYVLVRLALPTSAHRDLGEIPGSPLPHWASDHAGLVATVHLF